MAKCDYYKCGKTAIAKQIIYLPMNDGTKKPFARTMVCREHANNGLLGTCEKCGKQYNIKLRGDMFCSDDCGAAQILDNISASWDKVFKK